MKMNMEMFEETDSKVTEFVSYDKSKKLKR